MVSIAEIINSQQRSPVSYYAPPRPTYTPSRPAVPPSSRYTPPAPSGSGGAVDWNAFSAASAAFRQQNPQQPAEEQGGFGGSPFGKGLGFIINNPVTRVLTAPVNYIQTLGRAATLGVEEAAEAMGGAPGWAKNLVSSIPGLGTGTMGPSPVSHGLITNVDTERTEADERSNWAKVFSPNTTYGYGELLNPDNPSWANNIMGLTGDIALDPLTYVGGGATRTVAGAKYIDEAMQGLNEASEALRLANEAGDAKRIADATERVAKAEDFVQRAPELGQKFWEVPTPRNRAERANLFGELRETPAGRYFMEEMAGDAERAGVRGFQTISPEAKKLLGIAEPGLRLRGFDKKIPLTGPIAELLNAGGGGIRQALANLPGGSSKIRNVRTPKGLEEAYDVLTRGGTGLSRARAAAEVQGRNVARVGEGAQLARGNRTITHGIREFFKGKSDEAIRTMVNQAETAPEANGVNKIVARILAEYQKVTGRTIDSQYLKNPATYFPHLMDPKWRRTVAKMAKRGDKSAADFLRHIETGFDDLLEDPAFYNDNLLEGSGFLEKARKLGTDAEGNPQTFDIGGVEVTFTADDVDHINEQLRKAFPNYKGDFYDTDPKRVLEAYNKSLARSAGRDVATRRMVDVGDPLAFELGGDIDATRLAMNEALAQQNAAPLLSTAQGKYDPTQPLPAIPPTPVVPGSATERAPIEALRASAAEATDPDTIKVLTAEADRLEAEVAASRIGGVDPNDYFVTTKGELATKEYKGQAKRAGTYATAAAAETRKASEKLRQGIYDLKEMIVSPLKTSIKTLDGEIRAINVKVRQWRKTITDMGELLPESVDEMSDLITKVEAEITNIETKLKRTASSWKGQATRRQRAAESRMRAELEKLKKLRLDAWEKARAAPREIREEIELRERTLNQPVRDAQQKLLWAEMTYAADNAVPHSQAAVDDAIETLMSEVERGVDPEELRGRFRSILDDIKVKQQDALRETVRDTPEVAAKRAEWHGLVQEIRDIADRPKWRGKLKKADRQALDEAMARRQALAVELGEADRLSSYDQAVIDLADVEKKIDVATGVARDTRRTRRAPKPAAPVARAPRPAGTPPLHIEDLYGRMPVVDAAGRTGSVVPVHAGGDVVVVEFLDGSVGTFRRAEVGNALTTPERAAAAAAEAPPAAAPVAVPTAPADLPRLRAERNRLKRLFGPGGKFYKQHQAQGVLEEMAIYDKAMEEATAAERKVLELEETQRAWRQEAIIWKNEEKTSRYTTRPFERPSRLEEMGRGTYQQRIPEPITTPPQGAAYKISQEQLVAGPRGPEVETQAFQLPRTEQEAIASLRSLEETGGPEVMGARGEYRQHRADLAEAEATFPERLAQEQADIAEAAAMDADRAMGPLAERAKTYTNLNSDLSDRRNLVVKRQETRDLRDRLKANPKSKTTDLGRVLDELEAVAKANPLLDDPKLNQVESLLHTYREELSRINETKMRVRDLDRVVQDAKDGKLGNIMIATLNNNWRALHSGPLNTGDIIMDAELHKRFNNLFELSRQPKLLGRTFNAFTNLFKTYATLTPGFFVRNTIGGIFMNTADGVALRAQAEGAEKWQMFLKHGTDWLDAQPKRVQDAFEAAFASGAGGRFEDAGVLAKTDSKFYNLISSNKLTRAGQRWGTRVEGGMRLGMALDSIDNGMGVQGALQRITRVHFDYAQVSQIDETMKRIIPFWTFMSRNLPLQIQEQWTNPRVYSYYNNLVNNFSLPDEEFTPEYWTRQGAWRTPVSIGGAPLYMQPDLGFNRVQSDIEMLGGLVGGDNPGLLFSQANPMIGATLDFMNKRDSFYDRTYEPDDYKKMSGPIGAPIALLAKIFGQTNEAGQVSENFSNYLSSLVPPLNQVERLLPQATGQDSTTQTWVKRSRYAGFPIQLLTPEAQDSEYWRQWRELQDEQKAQRAMLEEALS